MLCRVARREEVAGDFLSGPIGPLGSISQVPHVFASPSLSLLLIQVRLKGAACAMQVR